MKRIEAYKKIEGVMEDCSSKVELNNDIKHLLPKLKSLILVEELSERFNIDMSNVYTYSRTHIALRCSSYADVYLSLMGKDHNHTIAWPDNGKQPENEWLLHVRYSTGAYMFGDDYPVELFNEFWNELLAFNPKYIDSGNNHLYFAEDTAKDFYNNFVEIEKKYFKKYKEESKQRRIEALVKELKELENQEGK